MDRRNSEAVMLGESHGARCILGYYTHFLCEKQTTAVTLMMSLQTDNDNISEGQADLRTEQEASQPETPTSSFLCLGNLKHRLLF